MLLGERFPCWPQLGPRYLGTKSVTRWNGLYPAELESFALKKFSINRGRQPIARGRACINQSALRRQEAMPMRTKRGRNDEASNVLFIQRGSSPRIICCVCAWGADHDRADTSANGSLAG